MAHSLTQDPAAAIDDARRRFLKRALRQERARPRPLPAYGEECGVFGIVGHGGDAAAVVAMGLHALQHRGQEAAGICTTDGQQFTSDKALGLVSQHFTKKSVIAGLPGHSGIGHTRYSTTGGAGLRNVQPFFADLDIGGLSLAHNGNLTNGRVLRQQLIDEGRIFHTTSDSEVFVKLIAQERHRDVTERLGRSLPIIEGAYGLVVLTKDSLIGVRDPLGIRPLVLGRLGNASVLASETCAFDLIGAEFVRDVEPGEMVIARIDGSVESRRIAPQPERARPCVFEFIYFARPNSFVDGESVHNMRKKLGARLAEEAPCEADVISPIPDGGVAPAIGYANGTGIAYDMGLIRGHYPGRTFIEPTQEMRELGVARKLSANAGVVKGKRVCLVDDSLVRGTTTRKITELVRAAGATEVHVRIACPPIQYPDYYGIDMPHREELLAATYSVEEIRQLIGADSLSYLSVDGLYAALGKGKRGTTPAFTDHCFTGEYPTALKDLAAFAQHSKTEQLSLLKEAG